MDKTYALFMGCTIPARARSYEMSVRTVAARFGLNLVTVDEFACCGFPMEAADHLVAQTLAARNLSIAEERNLPICTLCSSCTSALTEASSILAKHQDERDETNRRLSRIQRRYEGPVEVKHFVRIIWEEAGPEMIRQAVTRPLEGLRLAAHYGCHFLKPSEVYDGFDLVETPRVIDELIRAAGATAVDYSRKKQCCGGSVLVADERTALEIARDKLAELKQLEADAIVVVCPFCGVMFDSQQRKIEKTFEQTFDLPVLYLPQVLGLAMGMDEKEMGLATHAVKAKGVLEKLQAPVLG
jgi:heterodisulfide reductase subunit B2